MKQQRLETSLMLMAFTVLVGCGATKIQTGADFGSTDQSSTATPTGALAKCSHDVDNLSNLSIRLRAYEDGTSGIRGDLIHIKFDRFPTEFANNDGAALQVWTQSTDANGTAGPWHRASFFIEKYTSSGIQRTPHAYTDITWRDLKAVAASFGVSVTTTADMFSQFAILAQVSMGSDVEKILSVKLYDGTSSPEVFALAPTYLANPKTYAKTHGPTLTALHPLQAMANANYTDAQYQYESNQFCF